LIDGVVDNFGDQMVQTFLIGGTDIHAGALADRLQTFEDLNGGSGVVGGWFFGHRQNRAANMAAKVR